MTCLRIRAAFAAAIIASTIATAPVLAEAPTYAEMQQITTNEIPGLNINNSGFDLFEDRMAIGAAREFNDVGVETGAAYAYRLIDGVWVQQQRITPADYMSMFPETKYFGLTVAIRPDALVVGAPEDGIGDGLHTGALYTYWDNVGTWELQTKFRREDDGTVQGWSNQKFGKQLVVDGETMVVGVPGYINEASLRVFERHQGQWGFSQDIWLPAPENFQISVVDLDGDVLIAGSIKPYNGSFHRYVVHIYRRIDGVWTHVQTLDAPDELAAQSFRFAAVSGNRIVVGAPSWSFSGYRWDGMVYVFELAGDTWELANQVSISFGNWNFGLGVDLLGDRLVLGSPSNETVRVFDYDAEGSSWLTTQVITNASPRFGFRVLLRDEYLAVQGRDTLTIHEFDNAAPTANAGPDQTVQAIYADGSADVNLDGSGSTDPDSDPLTYTWTKDGQSIESGVNSTINLALGTHVITLTVDDGQESASDEVVITVEATIAGLRRLLDGVIPNENLPANTATKLYRNLMKAEEYEAAGDYDRAIENLSEFIRSIDKALRQGNISDTNSAVLKGSATATQNAIGSG